jgi:hypothetical protein
VFAPLIPSSATPFVDFEPSLLGLGALVGGGLFGAGYAGVEDNHNAELRNADATRQPLRLGDNPCVTAMAMSQVDSVGLTSTDRNRPSTTNNREDGTKNDRSTG